MQDEQNTLKMLYKKLNKFYKKLYNRPKILEKL